MFKFIHSGFSKLLIVLMKRWIYIVLFCSCSVLFYNTGYSQHTIHLTKSYSQIEYDGHGQVFDMEEDARGMLYFTNSGSNGILEYDGIEWRKIQTPNNAFVSALAKDANGVIYAGGLGELGYLEPDSIGTMRYISLLDQLEEEHKEFSYIWYIHITEAGIVFQSNDKLFIKKGDEIEVLLPTGKKFHTSFQLDEKILVNQTGVGLMALEQGQLQLLSGGAFFANKRVKGILNSKDGNYLVFVDKVGVFTYHPTTGVVAPFPAEANSLLAEVGIYHVSTLNDGNYAIATVSGGVVIMGPNGTVQKVFNRSTGLPSNTVYFTYIDSQNSFWLGTNLGIARVDYETSITRLKLAGEMPETVKAFEQFNGKLYMATSNGPYYVDSQDGVAITVQVEGVSSKAHDFMVFNDKLLVATMKGVYEVEHGKAVQVSAFSAKDFLRSKKDSTLLFVVGDQGIYCIRWEENQWQVSTILTDASGNLIDDKFIDIQEIKHSDSSIEIWGGTHHKELLRLRFDVGSITPQVARFDTLHGLPPLLELNVFELQGEVVFGSGYGLYRFEEDTFVVDTNFTHEFASGTRQVWRLLDDGAGIVWYAQERHLAYAEYNVGAHQYDWTEFPYQDMAKMYNVLGFESIYALGNKEYLIGCKEGILKIDLNSSMHYDLPYRTLIRKVTVGNDSLLFGGTNYTNNFALSNEQPSELVPVLPYADNDLTFHFAALFYEFEEYTTYTYLLEGYDEEWWPITSSASKKYPKIPEGDYTFRVKAINAYGVEGEEAVYRFTILPPWYRTNWAYTAYIILFLLALRLLLYLNSRRLNAANLRLRKIVNDSTAEIREQKDEIEGQRDEIAKKNKALMDSIRYAKSLQDAILPAKELIEKALPHHFVYFQPRDIVSGDFYWFYEKEDQVFIAAVDCTGHGVPGALVSMTGSNLLNQIIIEKDNNDPGTILSELNVGVKSVFSNEGSLASANDGMDIALCVLNKQSKVIEFAGAHRPMIVIRDGEIIEVKGDRTPIGGRTDASFAFTAHTFQAQLHDSIYIFSDGYPDQFGGDRNRKFMISRLKKMFIDICALPAEEQKQHLHNTLLQWQGNLNRVDDILIIGFEVL